MAGSSAAAEDYSTWEMSSVQRCHSEDSLVDWRSGEQIEDEAPSTPAPYWDTDDDDDGPKPSDLYGKFTWKIENFSQINKRELRSNAFEVGGYKWYILIYPQGCDVCNHLSLFLCVANHEKLLPGWSHFAQFTIAVVNKDPKKSKYSDTLHRFWKKEHDWGWKKFMELSKVLDGFIVSDTLVIKAQVQVIREKAHRPFRCLDCQYRRELVRVYLTNVEQICRRLIDERKSKLCKLIEDKVRWPSFRAFWLGIDRITKQRMSRDKADAILKVVVKHFFVEKEVTSTLVMDSLYSGLKALECHGKKKKEKVKLLELEELPAPMVRVEKDMFVLADDVLVLLERAALEPLPPSTPKDEKVSQNRTKDGSSGEDFSKDSVEGDERRLTELGRRTVEFFVLAHIFSIIEVAYQEAVALKRQEELIREEEAAGQAENEPRAKRSAAEKERRTKKKQAKQKKNSRKVKDRAKDEKSDSVVIDKHQQERLSDVVIMEEFSSMQESEVIEKTNTPDDASEASDVGDDIVEVLHPAIEDRDSSPVNWETTEIHPVIVSGGRGMQNGQAERSSMSILEDSSSTCSADSVRSVVMTGPYKANSFSNNKIQISLDRGKNQLCPGMHYQPSDVSHSDDANGCCKVARPEPEAVLPLKDQVQWMETRLLGKDEVMFPKKLHVKDLVDVEGASNSATLESSPTFSPREKMCASVQQPKRPSGGVLVTSTTTIVEQDSSSEPPSSNQAHIEKSVPLATKSPPIPSVSNSEIQKPASESKNTTTQQVGSMSRPLSAPLIPVPRSTAPVISASVPPTPLLSRSVSAAGRLGTDPTLSAPSSFPQSYRNAIIGKTTVGTSLPALSQTPLTSSTQASVHSQPACVFVSSALMIPPPSPVRRDQASDRPGFTFGSVKPEPLQSQHQQRNDFSQQEACSSSSSSSSDMYTSNLVGRIRSLDIYGELQARKQYPRRVASTYTSPTVPGVVENEFPHLDIINDLLDEEQSIETSENSHYVHHNQHQFFDRQYSFPGDFGPVDSGSFRNSGRFDQTAQYYDEGGYPRGAPNGSLHGQDRHNVPQVDISTYANGQLEGVFQNQWPYGRPDLSMLNSDIGVGYSYQLSDFSSLTSGVNGYPLYRRPGSGI